MSIDDRIERAIRERERREDRWRSAKREVKDARKHRDRQFEHLKELRDRRDGARQEGDDERVAEIVANIEEKLLAIERVAESIDDLHRKIPDLKKAWRRFRSKVDRLFDVKKRKAEKQIIGTPGSPHWGGCEDVIKNESDPLADNMGYYTTSSKRSESYGNPGSDHHTSQVYASARDRKPGVGYLVALAKKLGIGYSGYADDYKLYYITRGGYTFRVQFIAQNHGTGPHNHEGYRRA